MTTALADVDLAQAVRDDDALARTLPTYQDVWRSWGLDPDDVEATTSTFAARALTLRGDLLELCDTTELAGLMGVLSAMMMRGFALGLRVGQHESVSLSEGAS